MRAKRIDPRTVRNEMREHRKTVRKKFEAASKKREEELKDPVKHMEGMKERLEAYMHNMSDLRLPERPLIAIDSDESPLNTKFSDLFTRAREITTASCKDDLELEAYIELNKDFVKIAKEIKEKSASSEEAAVALVELFNYLTKHEKSDGEWGYQISCDLVNEILSIPDVDLDLVGQVLLAYIPSEIATDWSPLEYIGGDALVRLEARYLEDSKSGDKERVEKAEAWAEILEDAERRGLGIEIEIREGAEL